jgi:hypothetical protein
LIFVVFGHPMTHTVRASSVPATARQTRARRASDRCRRATIGMDRSVASSARTAALARRRQCPRKARHQPPLSTNRGNT